MIPSRQRVFISYARANRSFVDRLSKDLRAGGIDVWLDTSEIAAGDNWQVAIENGLRDSAALLYVATERSAESHWMTREVQLMLERRTPIIPLVLDDAGAATLPDFLTNIQWVDFRGDYEGGLRLLLASLSPQRAPTAIPAPSRKSKGYVFLSYAEDDALFVDDIKSLLASRGYAFWDYRESDRDYHNDLFLELEGVISESVATLSFVSPAWKLSRTAVKEYHFSTDLGKPVFLLKVKDPGPTLVIAGIPYIDFTRDPGSGFARLEKELTRKGL